MRVAIVLFPTNGDQKIMKIGEKLSVGIQQQGHQVTVINGNTDLGERLTSYQYIVMGTSPLSLFSKAVSPKIAPFLNQAGAITGKRCYAFVTKSGGLRRGSTLSTLMQTMEHEGLILKRFDIITDPSMGEYIGKKLHIKGENL